MLLTESKRKKVIGQKEVEAVIAKMARIPPKSVSKSDTESQHIQNRRNHTCKQKPAQPPLQHEPLPPEHCRRIF